MNEGQLALVVGLLLAAGLAASLAAGRVRVPGLVLVLGIGMVIGSDGLDLIDFGDFELARQVGIVALAFILYEGGLSSGFDEIKPVLGTSIALATLGTLGTAAITAVPAALLFDLDPLEALLLGSTVAATDAAAVFAVLRGSTLRRKLARTLEGESGINDPIAILLIIGCIEAIQEPSFGIEDALVLVVRELAIGAAAGIGVGSAGRAVPAARDAPVRRPVPGRVDRHRRARLRVGAHAARVRVPRRRSSPASCSGRPRLRRAARSSRSTKDSRGWPSSASSSCSGCWCSRPSSWRSSRRAPRSPSSPLWWRGRSPPCSSRSAPNSTCENG